VSDYNTPTGYGEVSENILHRFDPDKYDIQVLACNYNGIAPIHPSRFPVWGCHSAYAVNEIQTVFDEVKPDILFTLNDGYVMPTYYNLLGKRLDKCKWVGYVVFDGTPLDHWPAVLKYIDAVLVPNQWEKDMLLQIGINTTVISHGVDCDVFKPIKEEERAAYKKKLLGIDNADRFVFGMVSKNFSRKRFSELIHAFKIFKYEMGLKFDKEPILVLYPSGKDPLQIDLPVVCSRVGLKKLDTAIIKPPDGRGLTRDEMNQIYNMFDVNCLVSVGEGYGLSIINSCACGKPTVAINNTVMPYHAKEIPMYLADPLKQPTFFDRNNNLVCYLPDVVKLAETLKKAYLETMDLSIANSNKTKALETAKKYHWDNLVPKFDHIMTMLAGIDKGAVIL
jgi:glycosyltransferase involved in cell wall biosynthesis